MQPPQHHSRTNLAELKAQIVKKLGPEGSKQYFYYLNRFLSLKLTKVEFDKLCLRILGPENIPLHNHLIHSILRNACSAKNPPPISLKDDVLKHGMPIGGKDIPADGYQQNGSDTSTAPVSGSPGLSNGGDMLPLSPRKARMCIRGRRTRSSLASNGKTSFVPQLSSAATQSNDFNVVLENGDLNPPDLGKKQQHYQGLDQQSRNESEPVIGDERKEPSAWSAVQAPLGVPLCPVSVGGARRAAPPLSSSRCISTYSDGALLDSLTLRERMEQIALIQGLEGVSVDCANILNHGLDTYLKGLIRSCIELVGSRSEHESTNNNTSKNQSYVKLINGVKPGHLYQMQNSRKLSEVQEQKTPCPISIQDFRVAMELNPQKLGEDWPLLIEKICTHAFGE